MAVNISSSSINHFLHCSEFTLGVSIITAFLVTKFILMLPLSIAVFYLGHQKWRQHSYSSTSNSDIFSYHSAVMELIYVLGVAFYYCGKYSGCEKVMTVGYYLFSVVLPGETSFHTLTCLERYLAVVHPVMFLRLRQSGGVRIRNISTGCVWLLCVGWIGVTAMYYPDPPHIPYFCLLVLSLIVISFCSLSVLCVLIRPGPGETPRDRKRIDQSKQRAFQTITAITGVLWLFFLGFLGCVSLETSHVLSYRDGCLVLMFGYWFSLPSSLVLPLLFLHRAGKSCCVLLPLQQ